MIDRVTDAFARLAAIFGPLLAVLLIIVLIAAALFLLEMCLRYGHRGTEMFLPYGKELLSVLRYEPKKTHPAIRLELRLHLFFGGLLLICLFVLVLHALVPLLPERTERIFETTLVGSFLVCGYLTRVSILAALRLP